MDLAKQRARTVAIISKYCDAYKYSNRTEQLIISSSLLNLIWNNWNLFWRNYWIFMTLGGVYLDKSKFVGVEPTLSQNQASAYAAHFRSNTPIRGYNIGDSIPSHKEPTWGCYETIVNIATGFLNCHPSLSARLSYLIGLLPLYKDEIKDFQTIRNSFIHLGPDKIKDIENLLPRYIRTPNSVTLDILNFKRIGNSTPCFKSMTENMVGLLNNLYEM